MFSLTIPTTDTSIAPSRTIRPTRGRSVENARVYLDTETRDRLNRLASRCSELTKLRPSFSTLFRVALVELEGVVKGGAVDGDALTAKLLAAAGREKMPPDRRKKATQ